MIELPNQNHLEWILMGDIYGYLIAEDRRPEGVAPIDCDPISGLPKDEAPKTIHVPAHTVMTPEGPLHVPAHVKQTQGSLVLPRALARGGVTLAGEMTLFSGSDDPAGGGPGTPGLAADHLSRVENGKKRRLSSIPRSEWSSDEINTWREYAYRIRKVFAYWATLGLVDPAPVLFDSPEKMGLDGLPRVVRPTWKLLDLVRQKIPGTRFANRPKSILHDLDPSERLKQPQYARESFAAETGGSVQGQLVEEAPLSGLARQGEDPAKSILHRRHCETCDAIYDTRLVPNHVCDPEDVAEVAASKKEETPCPGTSSSSEPALPTSSRTTPPTPAPSTSESSPPAAPTPPSS